MLQQLIAMQQGQDTNMLHTVLHYVAFEVNVMFEVPQHVSYRHLPQRQWVAAWGPI